jgi:hypothetical protein
MQKLTLSDFLTHKNETIRRNAMSIQKQLIKESVHSNINTHPCKLCEKDIPTNEHLCDTCWKSTNNA